MDRGGQDLTDARVEAFLARPGDWRAEMRALRPLLLTAGLAEALKWGQPCYMLGETNLAIVHGFKTGLRLTFFQGALLTDPEGLLVSPGENSRAGRYLNFTDTAEVARLAPRITAMIEEAKSLVQRGIRLDLSADPEPEWPAELVAFAAAQPDFHAAFMALTPGRRRYWLIHFAQAKQAATRQSRIERAVDRIFDGKGVNEV